MSVEKRTVAKIEIQENSNQKTEKTEEEPFLRQGITKAERERKWVFQCLRTGLQTR